MTDNGVQHDTAACPMMPLDLCVVSQKVLSRILFASFYFSHPFAFRILFITTATTTTMRLSAANASIYRGTLTIPSVEAPSTVRRIDFHHTASNSHEDVSLFNACVDALIQSEDIILGSSFKGEKFLFDNTIDIVNMHFKDQHHFCKILPNGNKVNFSKPLEGD